MGLKRHLEVLPENVGPEPPSIGSGPPQTIAGSGEYSVYSHGAREKPGHPLAFLLPERDDRGFHAARNLLKPLNHLAFLDQKEQIAVRLGLHNLKTPQPLFDVMYPKLVAHQAGRFSTDAVVEDLARNLPPRGDQIGHDISVLQVRALLRQYATIRHMEFHPSDRCNLTCLDCTYGHDDPARKPDPVQFPIEGIVRIRQLEPASMVIIGGGEPTLFRNGPARFGDLIEEIAHQLPATRLALISNGTFKPAGAWAERMDWIRLSLDAATPETYLRFRGRPLFDAVIRTFLAYLDHEGPNIGIGFLFGRSNVHEYAAVARFIFDLVRRERPAQLGRVSISYRPLRRDPYRYGGIFSEAISREQLDRAVVEVRELARTSTAMERFLRDQTNVTAILGGNTHPPHEFGRCYYSQTFRIVRASGDLRPCFIRVSEPEFSLGNLLRDDLTTIAINTLLVAARRRPHCDAHGCRQCHVNYAFEQGLDGLLTPSRSRDVREDPMF